MKRKFFSLLAAVIAVAGLVNVSFAKTQKIRKDATQTTQLAAKLPVSDGVVRIDLQRLMSTALPQVLNAKPELLAEFNAKIDQIKAQTGIDLRQFEQLAVGVKFQQGAAKNIAIQGIALASGKYDANALTTAMKLAAGSKFREEKVGAKTIYIFTPKEIAPTLSVPNISLPGLGTVIDFNKVLSHEMAIGALDKGTLAFGNPALVREALAGRTHVAQNILALVNRNASALISFGGNTPSGLSQFVNLDKDELGANLDSIRQLFGAVNVGDGNATISVTAKTTNAQQATDLEATISGLQMLGKSLLGGMKGADKAVYARIAGNTKITRNADEVNLAMQIPQSDIDILFGKK